MNAGTIVLCIYIISAIVLAGYGLTTAAIIVGVLGAILITLWSCCYVSGQCAQDEEDRHGIRRS